jgi:hypothetical protein
MEPTIILVLEPKLAEERFSEKQEFPMLIDVWKVQSML